MRSSNHSIEIGCGRGRPYVQQGGASFDTGKPDLLGTDDVREFANRRLGILRESGGLLVVLNGYSEGDLPGQLRRFREEIVFAKGAHRLFRNVAKSMTGVSATTSGGTVIIGIVGLIMGIGAALVNQDKEPEYAMYIFGGR